MAAVLRLRPVRLAAGNLRVSLGGHSVSACAPGRHLAATGGRAEEEELVGETAPKKRPGLFSLSPEASYASPAFKNRVAMLIPGFATHM